MRTVLGRLQRHRAELVQAHVHLVGDITEIAAAAGGTTVVHLEILDDARAVDLDRLGILAANVEHGARVRVHHMGAQPVAEDFRADILLGKGQGDPAITGADLRAFLELDVSRALPHRGLGPVGSICEFGQVLDDPVHSAQEFLGHIAGWRPVLHIDDRFVVEIDQRVVADARRFGDFLANLHDAGAGNIAEEIGFPARTGG